MKPRILHAENDDICHKLVQIVLSARGYEVVWARNGVEAIALAKEGCSLILMDLKMPIMDGYDAVKHIREYDVNTPIIALTAIALKHQIKECNGLGLNEYMTKPFQINKLIEAIQRYVN